jgi:hypothetical protein
VRWKLDPQSRILSAAMSGDADGAKKVSETEGDRRRERKSRAKE